MDSIAPAALRKVTRELYALNSNPPEGIRLILNEDAITDIQAWIQGPGGTPYEGGCFRVRIQLSSDFPNSPPKCFFTTKIFHPNVSKQGDVCVSTLKKDWKRELGLEHILLVVKCLLIVPNPESALNEEAGRQLLERYDDYAKHARLMTSIHAKGPSTVFKPSIDTPESLPDRLGSSPENDGRGNDNDKNPSRFTTDTSASAATTPDTHYIHVSIDTAPVVKTIPSLISNEVVPSMKRKRPQDEQHIPGQAVSPLAASMAVTIPTTTAAPTTVAATAKLVVSHPIQNPLRQTLQGLPTHPNQTPAQSILSLKQPTLHARMDGLKDRPLDHPSVRTLQSLRVPMSSKGWTESRKRTLRRL